MYLLKRTAKRTRPGASPPIEAALARCVALTGLETAFIVIPREAGGHSTLAIRARYPAPGPDAAEKRSSRLTAGMRLALQSALESDSPILSTGRRATRGARHPGVLIAAPIMVGGKTRAALAAAGHIPAPYAAAVRAVRRIASGLDATALLTPHGAESATDFIRAASARQDVLLHELRVPLSAANLLLDRLTRLSSWDTITDDTSDLMRAAHAAIIEAQSIVRTLSQLQALNHDSIPMEPRPLQAQSIIERAIGLLPGSVGRLRRMAAEGLPEIIADPLWLTHILTNLLENAMTHTPAPQLADINATLATDRKRVVISVTSYGAGIPLAEQETILQPHRRKTPADDLTSKGLGLSIARYLVTAMRGELWLESDGYHSATFRVALPAATARR